MPQRRQTSPFTSPRRAGSASGSSRGTAIQGSPPRVSRCTPPVARRATNALKMTTLNTAATVVPLRSNSFMGACRPSVRSQPSARPK